MSENSETYENVQIRKTRNTCSSCEGYAERQAAKTVAILSCEGACLRGEISRRAANQICYHLAPEKTVRVCLGGAFTKDTGQRSLVRNAERVVVIEGCFIQCASRMMEGVLVEFNPEVSIADSLYDIDGDLFGIEELPEEQINAYAENVAIQIAKKIGASKIE